MQRITAFLSAAVLATTMAAGSAMAQESSGAAGSAGTTQSQTQNFSDEQLQQFADVSQEIARISQEYTGQLQDAQDEASQQQIRQEANDEMVQAVQDSGMSIEEFNNIGQAIQQDPQLMQRVQKMAQQQ
ncbi:hypothetical protein GCM10027040_05560 [Halomonas shantousis]